MDLHRSSTITLLILSILSPATLSMRYELHSGHTKCISEEIHVNAMSVGKYSIVNPHEDHPLPASHKITVKVKQQHIFNHSNLIAFQSIGVSVGVCVLLGDVAARNGLSRGGRSEHGTFLVDGCGNRRLHHLLLGR